MFNLRHFYYGPSPGRKRKQSADESNTFTAVIEQVKILQAEPPTTSSHSEPIMKTFQISTTESPNNEKRAASSPPDESESPPHKKRKSRSPLPGPSRSYTACSESTENDDDTNPKDWKKTSTPTKDPNKL